MFRYNLTFWIPVSFLFGMFVLLYGKKKKYPLIYYLSAIAIGIYINKLLDVVFFPIWLDGRKYFESIKYYINLNGDFSSLSFYQCFGNVLMTMPIGVMLAFLVDWSNRKRIIFTLLLSFGIEFLQLLSIVILHRVDRIFDIKDIVLNTTGGFLGLVLFWLFCFFVSKIKIEDPNYHDFFWFISRVAKNCIEKKSSLNGVGIR